MLTLIATSAFGLEALVKREVQALGFRNILASNGRVEFNAQMEDIPRLNICLRTADRVLLKLGEFRASDFDAFFNGIKAIDWESWIPESGKMTVVGKSAKSALASVRACQSIVKKAVIERLKQVYQKQWFDETGPEFTLHFSLMKDIAQIALDTSGSGLHKRGYRKKTGEAPIRENLAAALVLLSSWRRDVTLVDPMCGSGTILIEAAMIARNIATGLRRTFASERWAAIGANVWEQTRIAAGAKADASGILRIFGYDSDPDRIKDCKENARNAGVARDIVFERRDLNDLCVEGERGVMISNPPYGVKLSSGRDLAPLYGALYGAFGKDDRWRLYVLTADRKFPVQFSRTRPGKVRKLYNGTLQVNYYQYHEKQQSRRGDVRHPAAEQEGKGTP